MKREWQERIEYSAGLLLFIGGGGLWLQQVIVLYNASNLSGPVEGPFASVATRLLFAGPMLVVGTVLIMRNYRMLRRAALSDHLRLQRLD